MVLLAPYNRYTIVWTLIMNIFPIVIYIYTWAGAVPCVQVSGVLRFVSLGFCLYIYFGGCPSDEEEQMDRCWGHHS